MIGKNVEWKPVFPIYSKTSPKKLTAFCVGVIGLIDLMTLSILHLLSIYFLLITRVYDRDEGKRRKRQKWNIFCVRIEVLLGQQNEEKNQNWFWNFSAKFFFHLLLNWTSVYTCFVIFERKKTSKIKTGK